MEMENLQRKLDELHAKSTGVEAELGEVREKMVGVRKTSIVKFKVSDAYKLEHNMTAT